MASLELEKIVKTIIDSSQATIKLACLGGHHKRLNCVYKEDSAPLFYLVFPPDALKDEIDKKAVHIVSISHSGKTYVFDCNIVDKKDNRRIQLLALKTSDPASMREYFRVITSVDIKAQYSSWSDSGKNLGWNIEGITQDLSASGVLATFPQEPRNKTNIDLTLSIPERNISAIGHIVTKKRLRNKNWLVALHFDSISTKSRDLILKYLFSVQRKQLRDNVAVLDG